MTPDRLECKWPAGMMSGEASSPVPGQGRRQAINLSTQEPVVQRSPPNHYERMLCQIYHEQLYDAGHIQLEAQAFLSSLDWDAQLGDSWPQLPSGQPFASVQAEQQLAPAMSYLTTSGPSYVTIPQHSFAFSQQLASSQQGQYGQQPPHDPSLEPQYFNFTDDMVWFTVHGVGPSLR